MKDTAVKYFNLLLIFIFLLIPLGPRAKLLDFMSKAKRYVMGVTGNRGQAHEQ